MMGYEDDLRAIAADLGINPDEAVAVAGRVAGETGQALDPVMAALREQLEAGVGLEAAESALRTADLGDFAG